MALASLITAERLRELVEYDQHTGAFTQRANYVGTRGARWAVGRLVGHVAATGYLTMRLDGRLYQAHRLAWLYAYGRWPDADIDHINGVRTDNRIANLRDVTNAVNRQNTRRARADSQTMVQGVTFCKRRGRFFSRIRCNGRAKFLGYFDDSGQAHQAYVEAKRRLHVGCTL